MEKPRHLPAEELADNFEKFYVLFRTYETDIVESRLFSSLDEIDVYINDFFNNLHDLKQSYKHNFYCNRLGPPVLSEIQTKNTD